MLAREQAVKVLLEAPDAPALYDALFEAERSLEAHSVAGAAQG